MPRKKGENNQPTPGVQEGDEHYVDLKDFGAARAENARKAKQPELQRVNDVQSKALN
jgi:hypothetical protein